MGRWTKYAPMTSAATIAIILCLCGSAGGFSRFPRAANNRFANDTATIGACELVKPFFDSMNVTVKPTKSLPKNTTCGGWCCNRDTEERLRHRAREDFHNLIHHHSRSLQGLLATTADALREAVTAMARQSENKTLTLFDQVYESMAVLSRPSIRSLYQAMVDYVSSENTPDTLQQPLTRAMLQERFAEFFMRLFPIAYHKTVNPTQRDFTDKFKACLYDAMEEIQPFGDIPKQIATSVGKSLEATRVLVQALTLGKTVLDKTDSVLFSGSSPHQDACYKALLRMTYCPKCKNVASSVMPCSGFCTNVMRGCLTVPASELDYAWSGYVETVERLVVAVDGQNDPLDLNVEKAMKHLSNHISIAVMHAMENGPALEEKVRKICGRSELRATSGPEIESATSSSTGSGLHQRDSAAPLASVSSDKLSVQLGNFLASVVRSRTFYGTLADSICEEYPDKRCWNGERVGEYAHTVVDSSLTAQRYNPEFMLSTTGSGNGGYANANTSVIIDQLRHINQVVQSQLASAPDSSVLLSDEAFEGSGSGDRPTWRKDEDGNDDNERTCVGCDDDDEASGSGMGPVTHEGDGGQKPTLDVNGENVPATPGSGATSSLLLPASLALGLICVPLFAA